LPGGIARFQYAQLGVPIIEEGKIGDWYVVHGYIQGGWRRIRIKNIKKMNPSDYAPLN
jgi:hypothetical protein